MRWQKGGDLNPVGELKQELRYTKRWFGHTHDTTHTTQHKKMKLNIAHWRDEAEGDEKGEGSRKRRMCLKS